MQFSSLNELNFPFGDKVEMKMQLPELNSVDNIVVHLLVNIPLPLKDLLDSIEHKVVAVF